MTKNLQFISGHPHIKTCGIVAGDEESYELFKDLFDPIISARHGGYAADAKVKYFHPESSYAGKGLYTSNLELLQMTHCFFVSSWVCSQSGLYCL